MAFKRILLSEAEDGMELAGDVYDSKGRLIVPFGSIIDRETINRMDNYNVVVIKVVEKSELDELFMKSSQLEEPSGYFEKIKKSQEFMEFDKQFNESVNELKVELNDIVLKNKEIDIRKMILDVKKVIAANKTNHNLMDMLNCMRGYDDLIFAHSMSVSLICNVIAGWFGYSDDDADILTVAGLLHDIGKIKIPRGIITKPAKLTDKEYRIIQMHPVFGYDILKDQPIDARIKNVALMHHERYDGKGYPRKLMGLQIDEMARIVAIADVYDAMTSNRVYREGMSPFDVIEYFEKCIDIFEPKFLLLFLQKTAQSYVSNTVLLSDGEEGKIAMINNNALGKPVVISGNKSIDLSRDKSIKIVKLI